MIRLQRIITCDTPGCPAFSIDVLRTIDVEEGQTPDWQGWRQVPGDAPDLNAAHYCPACVANLPDFVPVDVAVPIPVVPSSEWQPL